MPQGSRLDGPHGAPRVQDGRDADAPGVTAAEGPLLVLCDGSEASKRALRTALEIAGPKSTLNLLVTNPAPDAVERCKEETDALLNGRAIEAEYYHLPFTDARQLASFIRMIDSGLLVIGEGMNLPAETLRELIDNIDYPVLMVRGGVNYEL